MGSRNSTPKSEGSRPAERIAGLDHKLYYSISEVAEITGLKAYVLRFWEKEFPFLNPKKNRAGNRSYQQKDIDLINQIKHLLYDEGYTIEGAKSKLKTFRYEDEEAKLVAEKMRLKNLLMEVRRELSELLGFLSDSKNSKVS
jgi:DNA-binding transcriptional MerR regulator